MKMLRDGNGPLSLSKLLCFVFAFVIAYDMVQHSVNGYNVAAFGLDMSAAFGRAMFGKWLERNTFTSASTMTTTVDVAKIIEARDHARGVEPTP
jgi:hypothetical protein